MKNAVPSPPKNPKVFMDISIAGTPAGRIVMEVGA